MVISLCFLLNACQTDKQFIYTNYNYFGTVLKAVTYTDKDTFMTFKEKADAVLSSIDATFNEEIASSEVARFNNAIDGETIDIGEETYNLIMTAKDIYSQTSGAYNPCVYYLVDLWGFSARFATNTDITRSYDRVFDEEGFLPLPEPKFVEAFATLSDFDKVRCFSEDGKYYLVKENSLLNLDGIDYYARIDLGGLIKGYAIDKLLEVADNLAITKGYISYGTSSVALMENKKSDKWDLMLTNPRQTENSSDIYLKMPLNNKCVSSSGDYERYYETDGKRYSHIIDASAGKPIDNGICAVTVICDSAHIADMLSTAICVMGKDKALEFIQSNYVKENNIEVIIAYETNDGVEIYSNKETNTFTVTDYRFIVK
ncbi:MAG TPA: FAD:protein FMN transferase, partial [Clostridia bacterium]|nr:FAD:protein FMN transferase [Clostridia bacterium]